MKFIIFAICLSLGKGQNVPNTNSVTNINNINNVGSGGVNAVNANNDVNNANNNNRNLNVGNPNGNNNQNMMNQNMNMNNNQNNAGSQPFLPEYPGGSNLIYRPCPDMDINCVRKYFEKYGNCKAVYKPGPDPFFVKHVKLFFTNFNLTIDQYDIEASGLNDGKVKELYVNELSDLVVLQVRFPTLRLVNPLDIYRFHRPGKVDAITKSNSRAVYPSFDITTVFRGVKHLNLKRAESSAFLDGLPLLVINPSAGDNPDPVVQKTLVEFIAKPRVVAQEIFLTVAPLTASNYIQNNICDYGLNFV